MSAYLKLDVPLIGDFLGTIPAMVALSKELGGLDFICPPSVRGLSELIAPSCGLNFCGRRTYHDKFYHIAVGPDDTEAYNYATNHKLYMTQAHFHFLGLPIPAYPPKPKLSIKPECAPKYDYLLSPFSVSLPENQRWQPERWAELANRFPDKKFAVLGSSWSYNQKGYIRADNVWDEFDHSWSYVANLMQNSGGLISIVTGTSHLAFALGVKSILLSSQDTPWGINPEALVANDVNVTNISVDRVAGLMEE